MTARARLAYVVVAVVSRGLARGGFAVDDVRTAHRAARAAHAAHAHGSLATAARRGRRAARGDRQIDR